MVEKTKRVFISDVHLGMRGKKEWFQTKHEKNLIAFFEWMATRDDVKDLVLLGDFFETWMVPVDEIPYTFKNILDLPANQIVFEALNKCVEQMENVFYLTGNHDMHVKIGDYNAKFLTGKPNQIVQLPAYQAGLLYAEHGSRFAMFNASDHLHDHDGYPLGYFITRILASSSIPYLSPKALFRYIDDALEAAFTTQTIASSVIEALMENAGLRPDAQISMPAPRPHMTIGEVKARYSQLWNLWVDKFGFRYALYAVRCELGSLGWFADRLCTKWGYKAIVLGHTHDAELDDDLVMKNLITTGKRGYANAGYWCSAKPTFVEVDKQGGQYTLYLKQIQPSSNGLKTKDLVKPITV